LEGEKRSDEAGGVALEVGAVAGGGGGAEEGFAELVELGDFDGRAGASCAEQEALLRGERHGRGGLAGSGGFFEGELVFGRELCFGEAGVDGGSGGL
jgi:hypothetical protein